LSCSSVWFDAIGLIFIVSPLFNWLIGPSLAVVG